MYEAGFYLSLGLPTPKEGGGCLLGQALKVTILGPKVVLHGHKVFYHWQKENEPFFEGSG